MNATETQSGSSLDPLVGRRLDALLELLEGCKWTDIAALDWYKPEEEKYATRASLLAAIDASIAEKSANND